MRNGEKEPAESVSILPDGRMTRRDAARYLGLSEKTLAMYASRKTGPKFVKPDLSDIQLRGRGDRCPLCPLCAVARRHFPTSRKG